MNVKHGWSHKFLGKGEEGEILKYFLKYSKFPRRLNKI